MKLFVEATYELCHMGRWEHLGHVGRLGSGLGRQKHVRELIWITWVTCDASATWVTYDTRHTFASTGSTRVAWVTGTLQSVTWDAWVASSGVTQGSFGALGSLRSLCDSRHTCPKP